MSNLKEIEFNKVCRTCLSSSESMKSLYETDSGLTHVCCAEMLMSFTPLKLSLNDGFPTQICCICISELNHFHTFQSKCMQSENVLRNCKDKIIHTEKTNNFAEVLIKRELPVYSDNINDFEEKSSNASDSSYCSDTTTKSLQDPLTIAETQKDINQELDLIKQEFVDIKIEKEDDTNTPVNQETAKMPEIAVESSVCVVKSLDEMNKLVIVEKKPSKASHMKKHAGEKSLYSCTKCSKSFTRNINLLRHIQSHNEETIVHHCTICDKSFKTNELLTVHVRKHSGEKPYACNVCGNSYNRRNALTIHIRSHTGEKPFACTVCQYSFRKKQQLTDHMRTHTGEKPYTCTVCERPFSLKVNLAKHMRMHTGEKSFACTVCDRFYYQKELLTIHMRKHTGEKPYTCTICGVSFNQKGTLTDHYKMHSGEKPYSCTVCSNSFRKKQHLTDHIRTHTGEKPYLCTICGNSFTLKKTLTVHMRKHTRENASSAI